MSGTSTNVHLREKEGSPLLRLHFLSEASGWVLELNAGTHALHVFAGWDAVSEFVRYADMTDEATVAELAKRESPSRSVGTAVASFSWTSAATSRLAKRRASTWSMKRASGSTTTSGTPPVSRHPADLLRTGRRCAHERRKRSSCPLNRVEPLERRHRRLRRAGRAAQLDPVRGEHRRRLPRH